MSKFKRFKNLGVKSECLFYLKFCYFYKILVIFLIGRCDFCNVIWVDFEYFLVILFKVRLRRLEVLNINRILWFFIFRFNFLL